MADMVDVNQVLAQAKLGWRPIVITLLAFLVIMLDGYDLLCMSFVAPLLSRQLGIGVESFGPVLAAAFAGIMLGGIIISPFGDRFGRKVIVVSSVAAFGLFSLLPIYDPTYNHLILYRLLTGLGLGGAFPGAIALTCEYMPQRYKGLAVNLMCAGVSVGAVVGGLLAAKLIPLYGWQSAFWIAAIAPLGLAAILFLAMPESIAYLAAARKQPATIAAMLNRFDPTRRYSAADQFITGDHFITGDRASAGRPVGQLFSNGRTTGTLLLWLMSVAGLFANAILTSWLPAIVVRAGFPLQVGIFASVMMNVGGILGTILLGSLFNRLGATTIIAGALALTAVGSILTGLAVADAGAILPIIFVTGMFLLGSINSTNTLMATFYPTAIRSTGVGWALGIGRIGAVIGPAVGGILLSSGAGNWTIFWVTGLVTAAGVLASLVLGARYPLHRRPIARTAPAAAQPLAAH